MAHSKLSPSAAHRWMNCTGCLKLIDSLDIFDSSNVFARKGTAAHLVVEHCILRSMGPREFEKEWIYVPLGDEEARFLLEEEWPKGPLSHKQRNDLMEESSIFEVDTDMIHGVSVMMDLVNRLRDVAPEGFVEMAEHFYDMTWLHPDLGGTADYTIYYPFGTLHIVDYKNGRTMVEAEDNEQLLNYCVGALNVFPHAERVRLHIVQPNADHHDGPQRWQEYTSEEILEFQALLLEKAKETENPNAPLRSGSWCKYCPASDICPELRSDIADAAAVDFADEPAEIPATLPEGDGNAELSRLLEWVPIIDNWIKSIEGAAMRELEAGHTVPGFKLVRKRGTRKWIQDEEELLPELMKVARKVKGKKADLYAPAKLKTVAQIEKTLTGIKNVEGFKDLFEMSAGAFTVAAETDSRPAEDPVQAAAISAQEDFLD